MGRARPFARAALALIAAGCANAALAYRPIVNYQLNCQGCHLPDGSGERGRVPSIRRTLVRFSESPAGRNYVVRVPGVAESPLSDADTAALLNWMARSLSDVPLPRGFVDYTTAEVGRSRRQPLADAAKTRRRLLRALLQAPARAAAIASRSTDRSPM